MKRKRRVLPLVLFFVASSATGTALAATSGLTPQGSKGGGKNDGVYNVTANPSTCSDGLAKTTAASFELTVEGNKVTIVSTTVAGGPTRTGEVSGDGFTISSTLSDGGVSTVSGTFEDGKVSGTFNQQFASGLTCTPSFSGERVGAKKASPADELIDELGLEGVFEAFEDFCDSLSSNCPALAKSAGEFADAFEELYCGPPEGCDKKGFTRYQRALPDLVLRAQLLAADGKAFPGVKATVPIILKMAFHGATDKDPDSARQAASAAWRLFATVAKIDLEGATL